MSVTNETNIIGDFTCHLYVYTQKSNIHDVITIHFRNKAKPKPSQKPLNCIKGIDATNFPRYKDVLIQHIKWSLFIVKIAAQPFSQEELTPLDYGWKLSTSFLTAKRFDEEQVPDVIHKIEYRDDSDAEDSDNDDSDGENESDSKI